MTAAYSILVERRQIRPMYSKISTLNIYFILIKRIFLNIIKNKTSISYTYHRKDETILRLVSKMSKNTFDALKTNLSSLTFNFFNQINISMEFSKQM